MDVYASNRSRLNKDRIKRIDDKVIVFAMPQKAIDGAVSRVIRFPYKGRVKDVYASCSTPGSGDTIINVERCPESDYMISPIWEDILDEKLKIPSTRLSSNASDTPYTLTNTGEVVESGDHYRISIHHNGTVEGIVVELVIEIEIEIDS